MSILRARLSTSWLLWGGLTQVLFVVFGFLPLASEGKGAVSYWGMWAAFLSGQWTCGPGEFVGVLAIHAVIRLVPAVVAGWVLQAIAVAGIADVRALRAGPAQAGQGETAAN